MWVSYIHVGRIRRWRDKRWGEEGNGLYGELREGGRERGSFIGLGREEEEGELTTKRQVCVVGRVAEVEGACEEGKYCCEEGNKNKGKGGSYIKE